MENTYLDIWNQAEDLKQMYTIDEMNQMIKDIEEVGYEDQETVKYLDTLYFAVEDGNYRYISQL